MATIIPFKGIRPTRDKVHLVASRSVDGYTTATLKDKLASNPYTFLHIVNPDFSDSIKTKPGSMERLLKSKSKYLSFLEESILIEDKKPAYYIYKQQKAGNTYAGIIGCISIDDYFNGIIKKHEETITEREEKLKSYLDVCDFNAEPVLFSYPNDALIDQLTQEAIVTQPEYDFTTTDKVRHSLWIIADAERIKQVSQQFAAMPAIYIADGHHRSASSALLCKARRAQNPNYTGKESFNFYMGIFFPENQLKIYDYNRVVNDLNGLSAEEFIKKVTEQFELEYRGEEVHKPEKLHEFGMYLNAKWYKLQPKERLLQTNNPTESLDSALLFNYILSPILGIRDLKTSRRISFVSGIKGIVELKAQVDQLKNGVAFALYPVSMSQLKCIADTNNIMPPKTTWIEPKVRSGLVIYSMSSS